MENYPYLWIHNTDAAHAKKAFAGSAVRWKVGAAYRQPHEKALYIHHEDLELAAQLMRPAGLMTERVEMVGTKDYLPMVHVLERPPGEITEEEMCFSFIVEAKWAAERIDWSEPDAYKKFLEEAGGPEDLDTEAAMNKLMEEE